MKYNLFTRFIVIFLVAVVAGWYTWYKWPPLLGIDLAGGTSLLYELDTSKLSANDNPADIASQVIAVLKKRVDPLGQKNMIWRVVGGKRIQIQMPYPPETTLEARKARDEARDALIAVAWKRSAVKNAVDNKTGAAREQELAQLAPKDSEAYKKLLELAQAADELKAARDAVAHSSASQPGAGTQPMLPSAALLLAQSDAQRKYDTKFNEAMKESVDVPALEQLLGAADNPDNKTAQEDLQQVIKSHPLQKDKIVAFVQAHRKLQELSGGGVDDPQELQRLVTRAGVLDFRIAVMPDEIGAPQRGINMLNPHEDYGKYGSGSVEYSDALRSLAERGPDQQVNAGGVKARWFAIDKNATDNFAVGNYIVAPLSGEPYLLCYDDSAVNNPAPHTLTHADPGRHPWSVKASKPYFSFEQNSVVLPFSLDATGAGYMGDLTSTYTKHPMTILLDDKAMSAPNINSRITDSGVITFGTPGPGRPQEAIQKEADQLKQIMDAGSLPATLQSQPISVENISSSMGADNIASGVRSAYFAVLAVVAFMCLYYTITGVFADLALMLNLLLVLASMAVLRATFTLPGIAGLVLTLGMAVDANVLINERIREEVHRGASLWMAIKQGYDKVFWTIFDANLTCSLTSIVLIEVGSEEVKGFGVTLLIGLAIHMFTALFVTRTLMMAAAKWGVMKAIDDHSVAEYIRELFTFTWLRNGHWPFMKVITVTNIDWIGKRHIFWAISAVITIAGIVAFIARGDDKYDIEFRGGTQITFHLKDPLAPVAEIVNGVAADADAVKKHPGLATIKKDLEDEDDPVKLPAQLKAPLDALAGDAELTAKHPDVKKLPELFQTAEQKTLTFDEVRKKITDLASRPGLGELRDAVVYTVGTPKDRRYQMQTTIRNTPQHFDQTLPPAFAKAFGIAPDSVHVKNESDATMVQFDLPRAATGEAWSEQSVQEKIKEIAGQQGLGDLAAANLVNQGDVTISTPAAGGIPALPGASAPAATKKATRFELSIPNTNIQRILVEPMADQFKDYIDVTPELKVDNLNLPIQTAQDQEHGVVVPITSVVLGQSFPPEIGATMPVRDVQNFDKGVAILLNHISPPVTAQKLTARIDNTRRSSEFQNVPHREFEVIPLTVVDADGKEVTATEKDARPMTRAVEVAVDGLHLYSADNESQAIKWSSEVAASEWNIVKASLEAQPPFDGVTSFDAVVAGQAKARALLAVLISLVLIVIYVWIRFGGIRYGLGAILSLVHDAIVAMAGTVLSGVVYYHLFNQHPYLLITDYKINLTMVAAYLTVIGYSVNDTIVIFDRVRELRGKAHVPLTKKLVNDAINQCFGRTIWTTFTVFIVVLIMYIWGGEGVRGFSFAMLIGVFTGAYSTLAIASPMLLATGTGGPSAGPRADNPFMRKDTPPTRPPTLPEPAL